MGEIPSKMRAMVTTGHGGFEKLELNTDWPVPQISSDEVLVKVNACGLNNTDINTRIGWYDPEVREGTTSDSGKGGIEVIAEKSTGSWGGSSLAFPRIQGADVCGSVVKVGAGVSNDLVGQRVLIDTWIRDADDPDNFDKAIYFGSECNGGYAEFTKVPACQIHPVQSDLSDIELATFATSYITAENMLHRAHVGAGDVVLIPGASGGVGSALIQLARSRQAIPIALCGQDKQKTVKDLGAEAVLPRAPENLSEALQDAIGSPKVDVVADVVGGSLWPQMINCLKRGGRYTCAGAIAGPIVEMDLRTFYLNDLTFTGATIVENGLFAKLVKRIESGQIKPLVAAAFPLEESVEAQKLFLSKSFVGNIVIDMRR